MFENYELRINNIQKLLDKYGIKDIDEAISITKSYDLDIYKMVKDIQTICFEDACYAYTIGAAIAFWIKQSGSILQIFYGISDFARYPATIYSSAVRNIITYIIPFAFTAYYPASYILRGNNPMFCIGGVVISSVVLLGISLIVWHKGLNAYESAGS